MNAKQFASLAPFLRHKSARQRVILYLLADGYRIDKLIGMRASALAALELPEDIDVARDEVLDGKSRKGPAFVYPNGAVLPTSAYQRLIRQAGKKALNRAFSRDDFVKYIHSSKSQP